MPNRILRDCTDSESVNKLSWQAEVTFYRLIMKCDDFGRYYADPILLKSYLFPRKDIRTADISRWLSECERSGLIVCYVGADGKPYAAIRKFNQRKRIMQSKFPEPPEADDGQMTGACLTDDRLRRETRKRKEKDDVVVSKESGGDPDPTKQLFGPLAQKMYDAYPKKYGMIEGMRAVERWRRGEIAIPLKKKEKSVNLLQAVSVRQRIKGVNDSMMREILTAHFDKPTTESRRREQ